jgi:hypothetical protein
MLVNVVMEGGVIGGGGGVVDNKTFRKGAILFVLFAIAGCASLTEYEKLQGRASKRFFYGDYDASVHDLVDSLRINPGYEESRSLLVRAYSRAVKVHQERLRKIKKGHQKFMWDMAVSEYHRLIKLNEAISGLPAPFQLPMGFEMEDYAGQLDEANINAAEAHYQEGRRLMPDHVRAEQEFVAANRYVPGYKDALELAAEGYYQSGLRLSGRGDLASREQAANDFKEADNLVAGYKDAVLRYKAIFQ